MEYSNAIFEDTPQPAICLYRIIVISILLLFSNFRLAAADTLIVSSIHGYPVIDSLFTVTEENLKEQPTALPLVNRSHKLLKAHSYVLNNTDDTATLYLYLRGNEYWELTQKSEEVTASRYAGHLEALSRLSVPENRFCISIAVPPNEVVDWTLSTYNISTREPALNRIFVSDELAYFDYHSRMEKRALIPVAISIFFQGGIWIMMLYMFFLYFQNNRDKAYLYYGLYMFFGMYYLLQKVAGDDPFHFVFGENPIVRHVLNEPVQWMIYFFYNLFAIHFLEIRKHSQRLYKVLLSINVGYVVYLLAESTYFIITFDKVAQDTLFPVSRLVAFIVSLYTLIHVLIAVKTVLARYIVIGSAMFIGFSFLAMLYSLQLSWLPETSLFPINFMHIGILLEILFFSLGLGKRINLMAAEKEEVQEAYIDQLKENEKIVQESNKALSEEVFKRTNEIIYKSKELEKEREQKLKSEYERQLMESEMNSLRLQMNPHFIFNSLNSIRYYILKEDSEKASDYITAFSKLLRMILQHSRERTINLEDELDALRLYIEFERQRFENKFDYSIEVGEGVNTSSIQIQPLLIQPFVENSIWHGLLHKEGTGHLSVKIVLDNKYLVITIEDDGIGRERSREYRSDKSRTYKSMGMQITKDRLKMMAQTANTKAGYEVIDLVNPDGASAGTRVIFKIKIL